MRVKDGEFMFEMWSLCGVLVEQDETLPGIYIRA